MKPEKATQLGQLLKARRQACGLSTHRLAAAAGMDQATIVRFERGQIEAPKPDKLSRLAQVLTINSADLFALAGYTAPADLPALRSYLQTKYSGLLAEDIDRIETYVGRIAKKRGFAISEIVAAGDLSRSN